MLYKIISVEGHTTMVKRLEEIGFIAGEPIKILSHKSGWTVVQVGDSVFGLNSTEFGCIKCIEQ